MVFCSRKDTWEDRCRTHSPSHRDHLTTSRASLWLKDFPDSWHLSTSLGVCGLGGGIDVSPHTVLQLMLMASHKPL